MQSYQTCTKAFTRFFSMDAKDTTDREMIFRYIDGVPEDSDEGRKLNMLLLKTTNVIDAIWSYMTKNNIQFTPDAIGRAIDDMK